MRIPKFRAYVLGKMYYDVVFEYNDSGLTVFTSGGFYTIEKGNSRDEDCCWLQQSTELYDGNDVLVYEGDVLEDDGILYTVVWCGGGFVLTDHQGKVTLNMNDQDISFYEVIGNLMEGY